MQVQVFLHGEEHSQTIVFTKVFIKTHETKRHILETTFF